MAGLAVNRVICACEILQLSRSESSDSYRLQHSSYADRHSTPASAHTDKSACIHAHNRRDLNWSADRIVRGLAVLASDPCCQSNRAQFIPKRSGGWKRSAHLFEDRG